MAVDVKDGELISFDEWVCEWERVEGRRQRSGVSYSPLEQTLHVSTPAQLSRSLLQLNTLFIGSGTCVPTGNHGGIKSSRFCILLLLLLNQVAELGSSDCGPRCLHMVLEGKRETCGEFSTFSGGQVGT